MSRRAHLGRGNDKHGGRKRRNSKDSPSRHHMIPRSRNGNGDEYNLFPWNRGAHIAWHCLFSNMTVPEVWENLDKIHKIIWSGSANDKVHAIWLEVCTLERGSPGDKRIFNDATTKRILEGESKAKLRDYWVACFGEDSLSAAQDLFVDMMMVAMFGRQGLRMISHLLNHTNKKFRVWALRNFSAACQRS